MKLDRILKVSLAATLLVGAVNIGSAVAHEDHSQAAPATSMVEAIQKVLETHPDAYVVMAKLETEDSALVYEIELNDDTYVHVNAETGELMVSE